MVKRKDEGYVKKGIMLLLATILVYLILGLIVNYLGMKIYSGELEPNRRYDGMINIDFSVQNNAPISLPLSNSLYYYGAELLEGNVSCKILDYNCGEMIIDMKKLDGGENYSPSINIIAQDNGNFTVKLKSYLNFFNVGIFPKSIVVSCYPFVEDDDQYVCEKV